MSNTEKVSQKTLAALKSIVSGLVASDFSARSGGMNISDLIPNTTDLTTKIVEDVWSKEFSARELNQIVDFYTKYANRLPNISDAMMDYLSFYVELNKFDIDEHIKVTGFKKEDK